MEKNKKQALILSIVAVVTLIALVVGATYAYFQAQTGASKSTDVKVTTYTTDVLTFTTGDAINIALTQSDFASGKGNATGSTFAKATLTANNKTNTATEHYYVYLNISNNTFTYSINESTPELMLTVIGPDGTEVTSLEGLTHTSVTDGKNQVITGFDVTTKDGVIAIANNREITASPSKEEQYTIKLTFVNYNANQNVNAGAGFSAKVMIQKEKIVQTVANICKSGQSLSSCIAAMNGIDETLYHHDASLTNGAGDNSYRYAGASDAVNNYVCFGSTTPCPADNLYRIIGVFDNQVGENQTEQRVKLIKSDYATSTLLGNDGDYSEKYVTIASTWNWNNSSYKGNNLANIAGYSWNYKNNTTINSGNGSNTWSTSLLNKTNLNKSFITNIGADWAAKIDDTTWKVGGNTFDNIQSQPAKTAYQNEIVSPVTTNTTDNATDYSAKVGLMYVSDYMYAAPQDKWTLVGNGSTSKDYRAATSVNWMYMGLQEWTISRQADDASNPFLVYDAGDVANGNAITGRAVRPVFSLTSSVNYASGSGTAANPIVVN